MAERDRLRQHLAAGLEGLGLPLPVSASELLLDYIALLARWNRAYNLSAVREPLAMIDRHLLDSLALLPYLGTPASLADLGSGAGLPGIPLAIARPGLGVTLVDSNGKKARFLRQAVRSLALDTVQVAECRVEQLEGRFDTITARAFASLADMLAWGGHLLAPGGRWLAMKGRMPHDEIAAMPAEFAVQSIEPLAVPGLEAERHLVIITRSGPAGRPPGPLP